MEFSFSVLSVGESATPDTVAVHGLWLEGARWDDSSKQLEESEARRRYSALPSVLVQPCRGAAAGRGYRCPVYVTQARSGEMDTVGHSTNFICYINLPSR